MHIPKREKIKYILFTTDALSSLLAFATAYYLRNIGPFRLFLAGIQPLSVYLTALPFATLLLFIVFSNLGLYDYHKRIKNFTETYIVLKGTLIWVLLIMAGSYLYKYDYSRIIVVLYFLFSFIYINIARNLIKIYLLKYAKSTIGSVNVVIIGTGNNAKKIADKIREYKTVGYKLIGFIGEKSRNNKEQILGNLTALNKILTKHKIDEVYIADPNLTNNQIFDLVSKGNNNYISFKITTDVFGLISKDYKLADLEAIPSLDLWKVKNNWWVGLPKRLFDLAISFFLLLLFLPIILIIYIYLNISLGDKVILLQKRVGYKGKIFRMYKFRTMKQIKVTKFGKLLRRSSLDELPQLINIIKGEMSMVGPRPEVPEKAKKHKKWQRKRLEVKPGLTGLWQILGRKDLPLEKNLEYDFYYINNQSFLLDITILLKTIPVVITGTGAY